MSCRKPNNIDMGHHHGRSSSKTRGSPTRTTPHAHDYNGNVDTNTLQDEDNETCLRTLSTMDTETFRRLRENRRELINSNNNSNGNHSNGSGSGSGSRNNRRRNSKNDGACNDHYDNDYNRTSKDKGGSRGSSSSSERGMSFPQRVSWRVKHHRYRSNYNDDDDRSSSSASTWSSTLSTLSSLHTPSTATFRSSSSTLSRRTRRLPMILLGLGLVTTICKVGYVEFRLGQDQLRGTTTTGRVAAGGGVTKRGGSKEAAVDRRNLMTDNRDYFLPPDMEDDYVKEEDVQGQAQGQVLDQEHRGLVQQQVPQGERKQRWSTRLGRMVDMDPSEIMDEDDDDVSSQTPEHTIDEDDAYQPELVSDAQKEEEGSAIAPPLRGSPEWLELYKAGKITSDIGAPPPPPPDLPSSGGGGGEVVEAAQSQGGHDEGHDESSGHPPQYSVEEYLADEANDEESGYQQQQQPEDEGHDEGSGNQQPEHQEDAETTQLREQFERQLANEVEEQVQANLTQEEELQRQQEQKEEEERLKAEKEKERQRYREEHPQYPQFENQIAVKKFEHNLRWQQEVREKEARRQYKLVHPQYPTFKKIETASPVPAPVSDPNNGEDAVIIPITDIVPIVNTDSNWNTKFLDQSNPQENPQEEEDGTPVNIDEEWEGGGGDAIPITNTQEDYTPAQQENPQQPDGGIVNSEVHQEDHTPPQQESQQPDGGIVNGEVHQEDHTPPQQENQQPGEGLADSEVQQAVQAVGQVDLDKFYSQ